VRLCPKTGRFGHSTVKHHGRSMRASRGGGVAGARLGESGPKALRPRRSGCLLGNLLALGSAYSEDARRARSTS
jgi:hypothetical protein